MRRRAFGALMMILCLLLAGCGGTMEDPEILSAAVRETWTECGGYRCSAKITADYGRRVYSYEATVSGTPEQGTLTVDVPEEIAGTWVSWSGGERELSYGEITLETGALSPDGLSPGDVMPLFMDCISSATAEECTREVLEDRESIRLTCRNPRPGGENGTVTLWFASDSHELLRGEVSWEGVRVITVEFTQFSFA